MRQGLSPRGRQYDYKPAPTWTDDDGRPLDLSSMSGRDTAMGQVYSFAPEASAGDDDDE
jgi:hypothetical protein